MQLDGLSALSRDSPQSTCSSNLDERSVQHICRTAAQCAPHLEYCGPSESFKLAQPLQRRIPAPLNSPEDEALREHAPPAGTPSLGP